MANCTLFIVGGFPLRESNPGPWTQAPNRQQYMTDALTDWAKSLFRGVDLVSSVAPDPEQNAPLP